MTRPKGSGQYGRYSRYTAEEIADIRATYAQFVSACARRNEVMERLQCPPRTFWDIGNYLAGKKPRMQP
jgi:DNA invertase Pin-like site-specific DNA recombinase